MSNGIEFDPDHVLTALVHGFPGVGKTPSTVGTVPGPALILDVEGRTRFVQRPKISWNPLREPPPVPDGTWEICVVQARTWQVARSALDYVITGKHQFRSVVCDSLTELQKRAKDNLTGGDGTLSERLWGELLIAMENYIRNLRDAVTHPVQPLQCVIITAITEERDGRWGPWVQGSLIKTLPGLVDVIGYLYVDDEDENGSASPKARRMLVSPAPTFVSKDATSELPGGGISGRIGTTVSGPVNWAEIIDTIF